MVFDLVSINYIAAYCIGQNVNIGASLFQIILLQIQTFT